MNTLITPIERIKAEKENLELELNYWNKEKNRLGAHKSIDNAIMKIENQLDAINWVISLFDVKLDASVIENKYKSKCRMCKSERIVLFEVFKECQDCGYAW